MPLPIRDVVDVVVENTLKRGSPVAVPEDAAHGWARDLNLPKGGNLILYTSLLYQMIPYARASAKQMERLEESSVGGALLKLGKVVSSVFDISKLASGVSKEEISLQHDVLKTIASLLKKIGVEFGYLYDEELYVGVLLYDFGRDEDFSKHAKRVYDVFRKNGVKKVITVDPHTTYILREVYPKFVDGFDVEVDNYLEMLAKNELSPVKQLETCVTIHDPCYYARYLGIVNQPRELLSRAGVEIKEPSRTKELTFCCGGPIESLSPRLSKEVASLRVPDLKEACKNVVTMCPFCFISLSRAGQENIYVKDISLYLKEAYLG